MGMQMDSGVDPADGADTAQQPGVTAPEMGIPGAPFDPAEVAEGPAFMRAAGLVVDEVGPTRVTGHIDLGPDHHTPFGIVHGGVYSSAVETAASFGATIAVAGEGRFAVGLTNTTHFLHAVRDGRVEVEAVALYQGRTHQLWRVSIVDTSGRLVAHGELRLQNLDAVSRPGTTSGTGSP